jgi:hypothetical protein
VIVTLDTGILARASFRSSGPARRLLQELAFHPKHVVALSPFILGELGQVLAYGAVAERLRLTGDGIHEHLAFLRRIARIVDPPRNVPVFSTIRMTIQVFIPPWKLAPMSFVPGIGPFTPITFGLFAAGAQSR